jgi:hypothetical protein
MSAAATAAGYLYASGRLRGRNGREHENHDSEHHRDNERHYGRDEHAPEAKKAPMRVAVVPEQQAPAAPKKAPKIQYRTRRWRPE